MQDAGYGLPTCLTLDRSSAVCSRCKLLGHRLYTGIARGLPVAREWVGLFSARVPPVPGVRSGSKEVCARLKSECPPRTADGRETQPKRRCVRV
jgi:H2-forming N5,N10-methylenetetrahydromethanopterin dehydrogenase-like enzyme